MGYRRLVKEYLRHVKMVLGTDLIEIAALTSALDKREIGELRAIAAELQRESFSQAGENPYAAAVGQMLAQGQIDLTDLARVEGVDVADETEQLSVEAFKRILRTMVAYAKPEDSEVTDVTNDPSSS